MALSSPTDMLWLLWPMLLLPLLPLKFVDVPSEALLVTPSSSLFLGKLFTSSCCRWIAAFRHAVDTRALQIWKTTFL